MTHDPTDYCVSCAEPVHFGSGRFVNRVPADGGWLCGVCAEPIGYEHHDTGDFYCNFCAEEKINTDDIYEDPVTAPWSPAYADDFESAPRCTNCGAKS